MPRDSNGNYVLPLPEVVAGNTVESAWANTTMADLAAEISNSLSRDGEGGMRVPLQFPDGSQSDPGFQFIGESNTGMYRAGTGDYRFTVLGQDTFRLFQGNAQVYDQIEGAWASLAQQGSGGGGVLVRPGNVAGDMLYWDTDDVEWEPTSALSFDRDTGTITITNLTVSGDATLPEGAVTGSLVAGAGIDITGDTITNSLPDREVTISGGGSITVTGTYPNFVITSTAGQAYTAGNGIALAGTQFSVAAGNGLAQDASGLKMSGSYSGSFTASGDITAYSDRRLKENIDTLAPDTTLKMRGVSFTKDGVAGAGVIAQELQTVAPELVHEDSDGTLSVAYGNVVGYLIETIKDMDKRLKRLEG